MYVWYMPIPSTGRACLALAQSVCWLLQATRRGRCCADRPFFCVALQCPARALVAGQHGSRSMAARRWKNVGAMWVVAHRCAGQVRGGCSDRCHVERCLMRMAAAPSTTIMALRKAQSPHCLRRRCIAAPTCTCVRVRVRVRVAASVCVLSPAFASCCHRINADALMRPIPLRSCSNAADSRHSRDVRDASKKQLATAKHRTA